MFSTNSIFAKNVQNTNSVMTNTDAQNKITLALYTKLSVYVRTIRTLLTEYSKGNFYTVANILTDTVYKKMSQDLLGLAANPQKFMDYENLRLANTAALEGLYQSVMQYSNLVDTEVKLEKAKEFELILKDPERLKEYIKMLQGRTTLFKDSTVQVKPVTLKPEYAQYIKRFGFPEGGVFEMDKLAMAMNDLNRKGGT
jgi:hypothetical protein